MNSVKETVRMVSSSVFKNPTRSVGAKLFLVFVINICIFVFVVGMFAYSVAKNAIEDRSAESSYQTMIQASQKLDLQLTQFNNMTMQIMFDPNLKTQVAKLKGLKDGTYDMIQGIDSISKTLQTYSMSNDQIENIYLIPKEKTDLVIAAMGVRRGLDKVWDSDWFQEAKSSSGQSIWVSTQMGGLSDAAEPTFGIARPMRDLNSGEANFIIYLEIKQRTLKNSLRDIHIGDGSSIQILNSNGQYIHAPNDELLTQVAAEWLQPVKEEGQKSLSGSSIVSSDQDGKMMLVYDQIKVNGWTLVGAVPVTELTKDASTILMVTFLSMGGALLLAIIIGGLVVQWVATPIVKLLKLMNEGAQGNLAVRSDVKTKDEIGQLSAGFNTMMEQITSLVQSTEASARSVLDTATSLSEASRSTATSAKEIAVATEEIAKGATSLAVEAERGHDLTHNMASHMQHVVDANEQMDTSAQAVAESSELGASNMTSLLTRTESTGDMMRSLAERIKQLSESTQSIRKVLEMIHNMTKQTNILSLNATIEAARAGAAGKGFMVVADEIRNLADQSRQSIDVVGQITERIETEITETVAALSAAFPIFQKQAEAVQETDAIFGTVQQQMGGMIEHLGNVTGSINRLNEAQSILVEAMSNVSAVAEEASATSEEVASLSTEQLNISNRLVELSQELEEVSSNLKDTLSQFKY
ncbi:methyl-accepting chemotaxis protein [Paenibacillus thiaminolyticus]|uniref:methyl-accepting chemotaxis protein n=1 Tax=Paenibacillus thiaminolyticus TaxID=49283 RepID=UPI00233056D8|nr:methyl-accepting chemotaxis protein [Paenibacillus thiaminolyticus]WCF07388.1 methyl-accepting chemotaxis protein [Paenibacillus thiaminolyticus]